MANYITKDYLLDLRSLLGIDQELFAFALGISKSYVSKIETGHMEIVPKLEKKLRPKAKSLADRIDAEGVRAVVKDLQEAQKREQAGNTDDEANVLHVGEAHVEYKVDEPQPRKAKAGLLTTHNQSVVIRGLLANAIDPLPNGNYQVFDVEGMSMFPSICQGDKLLCRNVTHDDIIDGRIHILVANRPDLNEVKPDGVWVKRCYFRKQSGYISCKSDNHDSNEPFITFRLKQDEVLEIWYPVLRITGHMADPNRDLYMRMDEIENRLEMLESLNDIE